MKKLTTIILTLLCVLRATELYGQIQYDILFLPFNTSSKELAPAFYKKGMVFCSDRQNEILIKYSDYRNNPLSNLYKVDLTESLNKTRPQLLAKELTTFMFEGPAVFSNDDKTIYFTRSMNVSGAMRKGKVTDSTFGIFTSRITDAGWSKPVPLDLISREYNSGFPFITEDNKFLYFCSDAPGGLGGMDIYVSERSNGGWTAPVNLGPAINTSKNDVFPFMHKGGRLYFASRGYTKNGDLDIYYSVNKEGTWQPSIAVGTPFNSSADDYGLIFTSSLDTGYFVSDRKGSDDLYAVYLKPPEFVNCTQQVENDYCFVFYESNNDEIDTSLYAYEWDLGDGTKIQSIEAEHCFAGPGNYLVKLNIIDKLTADVMVSQATYNFSVEKVEQPYILSPDTVLVGKEFLLNASESNLPGFKIANCYWDFGDGNQSRGIETKHKYEKSGTYSVILGVTDRNNAFPGEGRKNCIIKPVVAIPEKK